MKETLQNIPTAKSSAKAKQVISAEIQTGVAHSREELEPRS